MEHKGGVKGITSSCQAGDMSIGFPAHSNVKYVRNDKDWSPELESCHKFIRGNHDDPALCRSHPNYLGDYGFADKPNIFYVSGGYSVDHTFRIPDLTWWSDEELSEDQMNSAIVLYEEMKPKIMVSHECPLAMKIDSVTNKWKFDHNSRTELMLQSMFEIHQPDYWIFGHHHQRKETDKNGTHFVCLDELLDGKINDCIYEIPNLEWE
jgi:DNA repair exonuclease SbcCD nuclease subunit